MDEEVRSRMFLFTVAGLALTLGSLQIALIVYLRQIGVEQWIGFLTIPMGAGVGLLSVAISARMWKH